MSQQFFSSPILGRASDTYGRANLLRSASQPCPCLPTACKGSPRLQLTSCFLPLRFVYQAVGVHFNRMLPPYASGTPPGMPDLDLECGYRILIDLMSAGSHDAGDQAIFIMARVLPGLLKCGVAVSQAFVTDVSAPSERAQNLGRQNRPQSRALYVRLPCSMWTW